MNNFFKLCPKCGENQIYKRKSILLNAIKHNTICHFCRRIPVPIEGYKRICKLCGSEQKYSCRRSYLISEKKNLMCQKCASNKSKQKRDKSYTQTEIFKKNAQQYALNQWKEKREEMLQVMRSEKYKEKHRNNTKKMWANKEKRKLMMETAHSEKAKQKWRNSALKTFNTEEYKEKQRNIQIELRKDKTTIFHSEKWKEKLRIARVKQMKKTGTFSNFNPVACEYFDQLNKAKGWNLQHALNGGEVEVYGYFLDAYDKDKNIVVEYDEEYHNTEKQKQKDFRRQNRIIEKINPIQFLRYDEKKQNLYDVIVRKEG